MVETAVLSAGSGSFVVDDARATSDVASIVDPVGTRNVIVTVTAAPAPTPTLPTGHDTVRSEPGGAHVPAEADAETKSTPAGTSSVMTTSAAVFGPSLVTVIVDVAVAPELTGSGVVDLVTCRSAFAIAGVLVSLPTYWNGWFNVAAR